MYYLAQVCKYTTKHLTVGVGIVFRWHMTKKYVNTGYLIKVTDGIRESRCFYLELINRRHCLLFDSVEYICKLNTIFIFPMITEKMTSYLKLGSVIQFFMRIPTLHFAGLQKKALAT